MQNNQNNKDDVLNQYVVRLNIHERLQHLLTVITFFILVVTGFLLKLPEDWIEKIAKYVGPNFYTYRTQIHHWAGALMILTCFYHIFYCIFHKDGRQFIKDMIPRWKDAVDIAQNIAYFLGKRPEPPKFDRFDYKEKMEYLALVAGTIIVSVTGIILWFNTHFSSFAVDLSDLIHVMEATLATMAIIVWHFYAVHWKPGKYPMSWIWIDGKMHIAEVLHEHPLWYERLVKEGKVKPLTEEQIEALKHMHHIPEPSLFKRVCNFFFKLLAIPSIIFFIGVLLFLAKLLYFPTPAATQISKEQVLIEQAKKEESEVRKWMGHFHNIDNTIYLKVNNPPVCMTCHGIYPHSKSPEVRALLNMHTYFFACEVCHVRRNEVKGRIDYVWFDNKTSEPIQHIKMTTDNGVYGAMLVPVLTTPDGKKVRLDQINKDFVQQYLKVKDKLSPEEQARAKALLHRHLTRKPVNCDECHRKDGYLNFVAIGYPPKRAASLYRTEVARMIDRYMKFYLPTMFDPELMKQQRLRRLQQQGK
ncbi:formate dehydrogenase subunit gamma [Thermodesulfatator atlanticus]|uniref:formate dehydrogenase subunit gamma n=1 Tax=Thermodesulfatator atlanticus TaxID=501497 RepID=UPI0003B448A5|nr:cytochrome b/b6 domain-containing protein [Thermodesulfatator atlanticus]